MKDCLDEVIDLFDGHPQHALLRVHLTFESDDGGGDGEADNDQTHSIVVAYVEFNVRCLVIVNDDGAFQNYLEKLATPVLNSLGWEDTGDHITK